MPTRPAAPAPPTHPVQRQLLRSKPVHWSGDWPSAVHCKQGRSKRGWMRSASHDETAAARAAPAPPTSMPAHPSPLFPALLHNPPWRSRRWQRCEHSRWHKCRSCRSPGCQGQGQASVQTPSTHRRGAGRRRLSRRRLSLAHSLQGRARRRRTQSQQLDRGGRLSAAEDGTRCDSARGCS